jgi:hypothetical protein
MTASPVGHRLPGRLPHWLPFLALVLPLLAVAPAHADDDGPMEAINDYVVYSPTVVKGQSEIEFRAAQYRDSSVVLDSGRGYVFSVAHSFTDWWKTELYLGQFQRAPRQPNTLMAYEFENTFQLAPSGEFWADPGFLLSYGFATHTGAANELEFGPLFEKRSGRFTQRLNLIWERELGNAAESHGYTFRSAYSLSYTLRTGFAPGLEVFLQPKTDVYQLGPVIYGEHYFGAGEFEYSAGVTFAMSRNAPDATLMLRLEYEFF